MPHYASILILGFLLGMFGCASAPAPEVRPERPGVQELLETSWLYHDYIAEQLIAGEEYEQAQFEKASEWLMNADSYFVKNELTKAQTLAAKSLKVFQQILGNFEKTTYAPGLETTLKELEQLIAYDPDTPLIEFLPELRHMLNNADEQQEKITRGEERNLDQMRDDIEQFRQLQQIISEGERVEQEIGDVSFETGAYALSGDGKLLLEHFADEIIEMIAARRETFPDKVIRVKVKVVGYTDDQGFLQNSPLARRLLDEAGREKPADRKERDTLLNVLLSEKRAKIISAYLTERIEKGLQETAQISIEQDSQGKGNSIPPAIEAPYPKKDARRRISRIYSYVIAN